MREDEMRVVLVGASGTIGHAVQRKFSGHHEIVTASSRGGEV
jgi:uncharacterized protein YbjT (DUF2867 family)